MQRERQRLYLDLLDTEFYRDVTTTFASSLRGVGTLWSRRDNFHATNRGLLN
jgi:hypothetical protein